MAGLSPTASVEAGIPWKSPPPEDGTDASFQDLSFGLCSAKPEIAQSVQLRRGLVTSNASVVKSDAPPELLRGVVGIATTNVSSLLRQLARLRWSARSMGNHMAYRDEIYKCLPGLMEILSHEETAGHVSFRELTGMARLLCWKGLVQADSLLEQIDAAIATKMSSGQSIPNEAIGEILMSYATVNFRNSVIATKLIDTAARREEQRQICTDDLILTVWAAAVLELGDRLPACMQPAAISRKTVGNEKNLFRLYQAHLALTPLNDRVAPEGLPELRMRRVVRGDGSSFHALSPCFRRRLRFQLFKERKKNPREAQSRFEKEVAQCVERIGYRARPQIYVFGFRFDIRLASVRGKVPDPARSILIECDGPHHRVGWSSEGRQVGKDGLQDRLARKYGFKLVRIAYEEWQKLPVDRREGHLRKLICEAMG